MARIDTGSVTARGLEFTVDSAGDAGADPVLLLHGFPQTRYTWRHELPALAEAGYRAIAPDQRGYSAGARPAGIDSYRVEELLADVLAIADACNVGQFHLVGHDWGGALAWLTAAHNPGRVKSLAVLSRPHPSAFARAMQEDAGQSERSRHHRSFQRAEATDELLADGARRLQAALENAGVPAPAAAAYLETLGKRAALDAAINWYRALGRSNALAGDIPPITMPTLYVWGTADSTVGRMAAEATAEFVSGSFRFEELTGVDHFITDQRPDAFPPLLLEHLDNAG